MELSVKITFLYFKRSKTFAPSWSIILMSGIFLADFIILDLESLSDIKMEFFKLFLFKNSLNNLVFFISF